MKPGRLTKPERALWNAFPRGELVDLGGARDRARTVPARSAPRTVPARTAQRTARARTVRAEVIAALLLGAAPAEPGRTAALRLDGARVTGTLDLGHSQVTGPVRLRHCEFDSVIDLSGARTRDIDLEGSRLSGLAAPLAGIDGNLSLIGCECSGQVALTGAHVTGSLRMQEASLDHPGHAALLANRLVVDDDLIAAEAVVNGEMRLAGARVGGIVLLDRAVVHAAGARRAVNAFNMHVALDVLARSGFAADGEVAFSDVRVGQNLDLRGASFRNPGGNALRCRKTDARRLVISGVTADGMVDFRYSRFTVIRDEPPWPEQLRLSGVSYDRLEPVLPAARRVEWLRRDADGYLPENYETLASMYRGHGDDAAARTVLLARERERRRQLPWHARAWSLLQEITVGYGYRPLRAGAWLAAFCVLGTVAFGLHRPAPVPGAPHPAFNSLVYSLDLLVPLVDFGLRNGYDPHGPLRWLAYLCVAVGWIFATTIAAGIARVLRRQ